MSRDDKTMEEHAREHASSISDEVELLGKLEDASDSDDLTNEDWERIFDTFDVNAFVGDCENCGQAWGDHVREHESITDYRTCPDNIGESEPTEFFIRDLDPLRESVRERFQERAYGVGVSITLDVCMYGGGPAGGIEFECSKGRHGLEMESARVWHQDWFQLKGYAPLDSDVAQRLFDVWNLEYATGEE